MARLTKRLIDSLNPEGADFVLWDDTLPGFGVRAFQGGRKSFVCQYRHLGRSRRMTLGAYGHLTVDEARRLAKQVFAEVAQGQDPAGQRVEARRAGTVADLAEMYLALHAPKKKESSLRNDRAMLSRYIIPALGNQKIAAVKRADVARLHNGLHEKPYMANRCVALLSKMMSLAETWGMRQDGSNPCRHIEKFREQARKRYLGHDELARLGQALNDAETSGDESPYVVAAVRLLLLTGCRLNEILALKWSMVDLGAGLLRLPDSKTGQKDVVLNPAAMEVLQGIPRQHLNPHVIVGEKTGSHWVNLAKPWKRILERAGIAECRIHDLRHSHAAIAAGLGLGLPIIGGLLGHTQAQTTARYAHLSVDPLRAASAAIGSTIAAALAAPVAEKVVVLRRKE